MPRSSTMMARAKDVAGLFFLLLVSSAAQEILEHPENTTVFLNQTAVFRCEVTGGDVSWRVNGKPTTEETSIARDDLDIVSEIGNPLVKLTIIARAEYNGTTVQCLVNSGFSDRSENVSLRIQGPLSAVGDLRVTGDASSVTISWTPPFSLIPDIWYSVFIYNVTDENNPTAILCTNCTNITETHYTFTPDYLSPCHVYNFSVVPLNGAGQGKSSGNVTGYALNASAVIEARLEAISRNESNVTFNALADVACDCRWKVTPHNVSDDLIIEKPSLPEGPSVSYKLRADNSYLFLVSISNGAGGVASPLIYFTTNDVQSADASTNGTNNMILVTGKFIEETRAKGCFVVLQCEYGSPDVFRALLLPNNFSGSVENTIDGVPASTYTMLVYDLEEDGLPNTKPAVEQSRNVTVDDGEDSVSVAESDFLKSASFNLSGSVVLFTCEFKESIARASCVLVYREYGNKTLVVVEYPQNSTDFPVNHTVDHPGNYTFAIFGKNNSNFDKIPIAITRMKVGGTTPSSPPPTVVSPTERDSHSESGVAGAVAGALVAVLIMTVIVAMVFVLITFKTRKKVEKATQAKSRLPEEGSAVQEEEEESKYTVVQTSLSVPRPSLPDNSTVQYQEIDIRTTHKMARSEYAELGPLPTNRSKPLTMDTKTEGPYVDILPHATTPVTDKSNNDKESVAKAAPKGPPTVELVMSLLMGVAGHWKDIAEGLGFDEDHIEDEIDPNNSTDEACLQDCVEQWIDKLQPSWEKLSHVLRDMGEDGLAQQALDRGFVFQPDGMRGNGELAGQPDTKQLNIKPKEEGSRGSKQTDPDSPEIDKTSVFGITSGSETEGKVEEGGTVDLVGRKSDHMDKLRLSTNCQPEENTNSGGAMVNEQHNHASPALRRRVKPEDRGLLTKW